MVLDLSVFEDRSLTSKKDSGFRVQGSGAKVQEKQKAKEKTTQSTVSHLETQNSSRPNTTTDAPALLPRTSSGFLKANKENLPSKASTTLNKKSANTGQEPRSSSRSDAKPDLLSRRPRTSSGFQKSKSKNLKPKASTLKVNKRSSKHKKKRTKFQNSKSSSASTRRRYIRKNYGRIMSISQRTLLRLGIPRVSSSRKRVSATASFHLHPSGSISGLHLSRRSGIPAIDRRTLQVIRQAHRRYPRPKTTVRISITMHYRL